MKEILLDTLFDTIKLVPFLFVAFLVIEAFEHKFRNRTKKAIAKSQRFGPIIGSFLGAIPQCGFATIATNLYVTRIITLGTLISIYLSTSDEMLPIMFSKNVELKTIFIILGTKVIIGMFYGFIIDLVIRKKPPQDYKHFDICDEEHCACQESILKSSLIHTLKTILFIALVTLALNILFSYASDEIISKIFMSNSVLAPMISSLIGLVPNCASSVIITEIYLNGVISFGTLIAGILTNAGLSLIILFKANKNIKENMSIIILLYIIGAITGIFINMIGINI